MTHHGCLHIGAFNVPMQLMSSLGTWKSTPTENGLRSATTLVRIGLDGVDFGTLEKLFRIIKEQQQQL